LVKEGDMTLDEIRGTADLVNERTPLSYRKTYPWEIGTPHFTGWKASLPKQEVTREENERLAVGIKTPEEIDFVGQWLYAVSADGPFFYVNLPGMQAGQYQKGEYFHIGAERVYSDIAPEEIERLLKLGLEKLMLLVGTHA
jgi:hypothetical protein